MNCMFLQFFTASPGYEGRVRFEGSDPMKNSSLIIMKTMEADEGLYTCTVAVYPSGNVDIHLSLTVYSKCV